MVLRTASTGPLSTRAGDGCSWDAGIPWFVLAGGGSHVVLRQREFHPYTDRPLWPRPTDMPDLPSIADISSVIQLSIAPVFLLVGIAGFINAFVARLSRVVDRIRVLEECLLDAEGSIRSNALRELAILDRRARLVNIGITLGITTALLVCVVIVTAFIEAFLGVSHVMLIGGLFIVAMLSLIGTLLAFLREVFLAIRSVTVGRSRPWSIEEEN